MNSSCVPCLLTRESNNVSEVWGFTCNWIRKHEPTKAWIPHSFLGCLPESPTMHCLVWGFRCGWIRLYGLLHEIHRMLQSWRTSRSKRLLIDSNPFLSRPSFRNCTTSCLKFQKAFFKWRGMTDFWLCLSLYLLNSFSSVLMKWLQITDY